MRNRVRIIKADVGKTHNGVIETIHNLKGEVGVSQQKVEDTNPSIEKEGIMKKWVTIVVLCLAMAGCTQETQNKIGHAVQNWTGTNGILEVYAGDKLVKRFMKIDKLTTATATDGSAERPYRYGYGFLDANLNGVVDQGEKKVYFEFSDYSTSYIFYENPK